MTTNGHGSDGSVAAAEAVRVIESSTTGSGRYRLANGVLLEFRHVAPYALRQAQQRVKEPDVPVVHVASKGRDEANPNDPNYLAAYAAYLEELALAGQAVGFMLGVRPVEVPDGMHWPDSDEWVDELSVAGIEARREPVPARLYDWLRLYAIASEEDLYVCTALATQQVGLSEAEVAAAVSSFRRRKGRGPDPSAGSAAADGQRDPVQADVA